VLRKIFRPKREEVTVDLRILHNGILIICIYLGDQIENNKMGGHVAHMGQR
jgi:hypothetical protein